MGRAQPAISLAGVAWSQDRNGATPIFCAASEVICLPLLSLDFEACLPQRNLHGQISARIPGELRAKSKRAARSKQVSVDELIRAAIEAHAAAAGRTR